MNSWDIEYNILFAFLTSLLTSLLSIPTIINIAKLKRLYDEPNPRKLHNSHIPTLGGIAILFGFFFSMSFWTNFAYCWHLQYVVTACIIIAVIGITDDIVSLSPLKKFIGQLVAAIILVVWSDLRIVSWFDIFGVKELPFLVSIVFSIFTILIIINAFNFIDGIDGLAASLGIVSSAAFGIYFYFFDENFQHAILAFSLTGALIGFLYYNRTPAKIFMGDTGSMLIGLIMAMLAIEFVNLNYYSPTRIIRSTSAPTLAMSIIFVPLFDIVRVFFIRIINGRSPFKPDKNHLHHLLLKMGFSHMKSTIILVFFQITLIAIAFLLHFKGNYWIGFTLLFVILLFTAFLYYQSKKAINNSTSQ
ncbi:MAG: undecaprenyl/decaprenyl-phosphate alpha-N-acetylglucosaminyl 1-phosphate transferase [Bacteroidales bacterium]|nr:undecaprenyl/decaprenyl-phosphate alpha-N-acetylglucosaminyl 1-phosphate transferase [Bacteroidales bacterium]